MADKILGREWIMLGDRFQELSRNQRRVLCCVAYGCFAAASPMGLFGSPLLRLISVVAMGFSIAAYIPLRNYLEDLHNTVLARDYEDDDKLLKSKRELDEKEQRLRTRSLYRAYLLLAAVLAGSWWYFGTAEWLGWWKPNARYEWTWLFLGVVWVTCTLPTVIAAWIEKGEHNLPYPVWEDDE